MAKLNKLTRFFKDYKLEVENEIENDAAAPANKNYMTDGDLSDADLAVVKDGIPYQGEAKSDIINSMLRQITTITYGVAQLMTYYSDKSGTKTELNDEAAPDKDVTSLTTDGDILNMLTHSINMLAINVANARIAANTLNNTEATQIAATPTEKFTTEKTIKNAMKTATSLADAKDNLPTANGWILDARVGSILSIALDGEITARTNGDTNAISTAKANTKADLKIKFLGSMTGVYEVPSGESESGFLYFWKGNQADYTLFSGNNASILNNVVAIID